MKPQRWEHELLSLQWLWPRLPLQQCHVALPPPVAVPCGPTSPCSSAMCWGFAGTGRAVSQHGRLGEQVEPLDVLLPSW